LSARFSRRSVTSPPHWSFLLVVVGLSALTGYLDYVLLPALVIFIGLTIYAIPRNAEPTLVAAQN